jgi:pantoate--beta-alanine ligase
LLTAGFDRVDYVAIRDAETLAPVNAVEKPARVLAAARIGSIRLIDNLSI